MYQFFMNYYPYFHMGISLMYMLSDDATGKNGRFGLWLILVMFLGIMMSK